MAIAVDRTERGTTVKVGVEDVDEFGKRVEALTDRFDGQLPGQQELIADGHAPTTEDLFARMSVVERKRRTYETLKTRTKAAKEDLELAVQELQLTHRRICRARGIDPTDPAEGR